MALSGGRAVPHYGFLSLQFSALCVLVSGSLALDSVSSRLRHKRSENDTGMYLRVDTASKSPPMSSQQERLHPGVIAAVVVVSLIAIVAAGFIIRKYCCFRSEGTYRYSVLRAMEEQATAEDFEDSDSDHELDRGESDEDLLE